MGIVSNNGLADEFVRPINSDLSTTLVMALVVIIIANGIAIANRGFLHYVKGFLFNWSGNSGTEKAINVFVGWLHLIGEFSKLLSLSIRLFGNIFAGVVLLAVMAFLTAKLSFFSIPIGQIAVLPFWCFEIFVALIQSLVFLILMNSYFKDARSHHH